MSCLLGDVLEEFLRSHFCLCGHSGARGLWSHTLMKALGPPSPGPVSRPSWPFQPHDQWSLAHPGCDPGLTCSIASWIAVWNCCCSFHTCWQILKPIAIFIAFVLPPVLGNWFHRFGFVGPKSSVRNLGSGWFQSSWPAVGSQWLLHYFSVSHVFVLVYLSRKEQDRFGFILRLLFPSSLSLFEPNTLSCFSLKTQHFGDSEWFPLLLLLWAVWGI